MHMATPQKRQDGFDCEFTEPPQEQFQADCPICLLVLREPHQVTCCGNSFCRMCIERVQLQKNPCPTCNQADFTVFLNKGLKRSLYAFKVRCSHAHEGCQWTGELGELDKHLNDKPHPHGPFSGCELVDVECCHCNGHFKRNDIITHQIETCTKQPYMLSLITRYIDHRLQNAERIVQERREDGGLFATKNELIELKNEFQTLEQHCRRESQAKLADQQKTTKLLWCVLFATCMMVMFVAVTYFAWNTGSQKGEMIRQGGQKINPLKDEHHLEFERSKQQKLDEGSAQKGEGLPIGFFIGGGIVAFVVFYMNSRGHQGRGHQGRGHRRHR